MTDSPLTPTGQQLTNLERRLTELTEAWALLVTDNEALTERVNELERRVNGNQTAFELGYTRLADRVTHLEGKKELIR